MSAEVAFWPARQRRPSRRQLVLALLFALVLLGWASGPRLIVDYKDLRCPPGSVVRYVGIAYWAVTCVPASEYSGPASAPTSRSVVLYLGSVHQRVFAFDFLGGVYEGPARLR
jgi:hypothetical protein